jgi:hypothetical protein
LQSIVAARQSGGLKSNFAATDFFQALPPAGPFPLDGIDTNLFTQVFFPQQMDVRLSIIPTDELPALVQDSMSLPPIDLTLPATAFANLSVFALIPVPRNVFASLKNSLPDTPLQPTLPQLLANRSPIQLLKLFQGVVACPPSCEQRMEHRHRQPEVWLLCVAAQPGRLRRFHKRDLELLAEPLGVRPAGDVHG